MNERTRLEGPQAEELGEPVINQLDSGESAEIKDGSELDKSPEESKEADEPEGYSIILDPEALRELEQLVPGAAKRLFDNAMAEAEHLRELQLKMVDNEEVFRYREDDRDREINRLKLSGQLISGVVMVAALVVIGVAMALGYGPMEFAFGIIAMTFLAGTLLGRRNQAKELRDQLAEMRSLLGQLNSRSAPGELAKGNEKNNDEQLRLSAGTTGDREDGGRKGSGGQAG